jgi:hypothetical protein
MVACVEVADGQRPAVGRDLKYDWIAVLRSDRSIAWFRRTGFDGLAGLERVAVGSVVGRIESVSKIIALRLYVVLSSADHMARVGRVDTSGKFEMSCVPVGRYTIGIGDDSMRREVAVRWVDKEVRVRAGIATEVYWR